MDHQLNKQLIDAEASTDEDGSEKQWGCCKLRRTDTAFVSETPAVPALMLEAIDKIIGVFLHGSEHARVIDSLGACPPCDLVITADFGMDMDDESAEIISFFAHLCGGKVHHLIGGEQGPTASRASESFHALVGAAEQRFGTKLDVTHLRTGSIPPELLDPARKVVWVLTASQEVTNGYTQIPAEHLLISQGHLGDFNLLQSCPEVQEWFRTRDPARTLSLKGGSQGDCTGHLSGTTLRRAAALGIDTSPAAAFYLSQVATQLPINIIGTVDATDTEPAKALYEIEPFVVRIVGEHEDGRGPGSNFYCMQGLGQHIFPDTEWGAEIDAVANRIGAHAVTQVAATIHSKVAADTRAGAMEKLEKDTDMFIKCLRIVNGYRAVLQVSKDKKPYASITDEAKAKYAPMFSPLCWSLKQTGCLASRATCCSRPFASTSHKSRRCCSGCATSAWKIQRFSRICTTRSRWVTRFWRRAFGALAMRARRTLSACCERSRSKIVSTQWLP